MKRFLLSIFAALLISISSFAQMSGVYSVGTGNINGEAGHYATLRDAVTALNAATFSGHVFMMITSSLNEDCSVSGIGLAADPGEFSITFKPAPSVKPVIAFNYVADINVGPSGAFLVGVHHTNGNDWGDIRTTKNIVFDGSNTVGGTTRDMTLESSLTSHRNAFPMVIIGSCSNIVVKNMNVYHKAQASPSTSSAKFISAIMVRTRDAMYPSNLTFDNNHISSDFELVSTGAVGLVWYRNGTTTATDISENIVISNNLIEGKAQAICLNYTGNATVSGNELKVNQNLGEFNSEAIFIGNSKSGSNIVFTRNKITKVASKMGVGKYVRALTLETPVNLVVSNNMVSGFELVSQTTGQSGEMTAFSFNATGLNVVFAHNSVYMNNLFDDATSLITYKGVKLVNGNLVLKNNILVNAETDFANEFLNCAVITADINNNIYYGSGSANVKLGTFNSMQYADLATWKTGTQKDAASLDSDPLFVSATNLHVQTTSPAEAVATPIAEISIDIDGETRNATTPDIGADEFVAHTTSIATENELNAKVWASENQIFVQSAENAKVQIFNMLGAVIIENEILSNSVNTFTLETAKGIYLVKIQNQKASKTQKVFIK